MYTTVTKQIRVSVTPFFLEDQSEPGDGRYVWAYQVTIENEGSETVQLISRHWQITDGAGQVQTVDGSGVVGEQPILAPGQQYEYTSGCPLSTPSGIMVGTYAMQKMDGRMFEIDIPAFSLDSPYETTRLN